MFLEIVLATGVVGQDWNCFPWRKRETYDNLYGAESVNGEGGLVAPKACTERVGRDRNRRRRMRTPTYELQSPRKKSSRVHMCELSSLATRVSYTSKL